MKIMPGSRRRRYAARVGIFLVAAALIVGMAGCPGDGYTPSQDLEIRTWYDLDAVRDNLAGNHTLMNNLDSTTAGYEELASPIANGGKGWQPIGTSNYPLNYPFTGTFEGQGYKIRDLFIYRPDEDTVGLFGYVGEVGRIEDIGVVSANVTGDEYVGGLVGLNEGGNVSESYSIGIVTGLSNVGGLVGGNSDFATVRDSYSSSSVAGNTDVGGLVGWNQDGIVSESYSSGNVTGEYYVGGLVGWDHGTVSDSHSTGSVTGDYYVGGLVGENSNTVSNSYSTGHVTGNVNVGGLVGYNSHSGTVSKSFWDRETSGQTTSDGGTGRTTAEMKDITTFSGAGWNITAVAPGSTNTTFIWNIVDDETYPFLSWQL